MNLETLYKTPGQPQVPGPNPYTTGSRIETSSENYASGASLIEIVNESVKRARAKVLESTVTIPGANK